MLQHIRGHRGLPGHAHLIARLRQGVAFFFIGGAVVHISLASFNPDAYAAFADDALFGFVRSGWREVFMSDPPAWALLLALGEATLGAALLLGGPPARWGYVGVIAFHVALIMFGWGFWMWSIPALAFLVWLALSDWPLLVQPRVPVDQDSRP